MEITVKMSEKEFHENRLIDLEYFFMFAKNNGLDVGIKLQMPGQKDHEIIMNYNSSIDTKLEYYKKTYDNNLVHKNCKEIKIIDAFCTVIPY